MNEGRRLKDLGEVVDCEHKTAPPAAPGLEYAYSVGTPALRGSDIDFAEAKAVSEATYRTWSRRAELTKGDIVLAREAPVGGVGFIDGTRNVCLGQRTVLVRANPLVLDPRFLFYALQSPQVQNWMTDRSSGSTVAHINVADVRDLPLPFLPPLPEQHRLAATLAAIDDLVATDRSLIASLLASADAIAATQAPGTEHRTFGDVARTSGGGTPSTKNDSYWGGDISWATPTDITALPSPYLFSTTRNITPTGLENCSSGLFPAGSILMTSRATIGAFAVTCGPVAVNQGFIVVEPLEDFDRWFLFHEMRRRVPEFIQRANGSTFLELSRGVFKALPLLWPDEDQRRALAAELAPVHSSAAALQLEIADLLRARNELLPILMSGRLSVSKVAK